MSKKSPTIAALISRCHGHVADAHYLGYFECFNRQLFYEAHDVLEELWLLDRRGPNGDFFKGLIQLAGAFVHLQKRRPGPAVALFKLADNNLAKYPQVHEHLTVGPVRGLIAEWLRQLAESPEMALTELNAPKLGVLGTAFEPRTSVPG